MIGVYIVTVSAPSLALWCYSWVLYCRCNALVVCGSTIFPKPMDFQLTAEITFEEFLRTLQVAVCHLSLLPFPHPQAQTVLLNLWCCGDWHPVVPACISIRSSSPRKAALVSCYCWALRHAQRSHGPVVSSAALLPGGQVLPDPATLQCPLGFSLLLPPFLFPCLS